MEKIKYKAAIIGATGMVGQRFMLLLENHPFFEVTLLAASKRSAGKTYLEAVCKKWHKLSGKDIPEKYAKMIVQDATDIEKIKDNVDMVFCAVDMPKEEIKKLEEDYAKAGLAVISNNSAHRWTPDVPMIIPEINPHHLEVIEKQRKRLSTNTGGKSAAGFIVVKSNCSIQSTVPALTPLIPLGLSEVVLCNYQAISGAGRTFETWPEMVDNVIPFIGGEEEKTETEPQKIWGTLSSDCTEIINRKDIKISAQCLRVPVTDGHLSAAFIRFNKDKPSINEIKNLWKNYKTGNDALNLPSAPKQFLKYYEEENFPQTKLHRDSENGMTISLGRLREDPTKIFDYKFIGLSHNTLRGAAGGAVLLAELCAKKGLINKN